MDKEPNVVRAGRWTIHNLDETDSTNLYLRRIDAPPFTAAVARTQNAGRGRLGRSFSSAEGGLYISFCTPFDRTLTLTAKAAVITARAIETAFGIRPGIKWLNDLVFNGRKVCGILAEGFGDRMITGIGVNVRVPSFADELKETAGSLLPPDDPRPDPVGALCDTLIHLFDMQIESDLLDAYRSLLTTAGQQVDVIADGRTLFSGTATGVNESYQLLVRCPDGIRTVGTGEVSVRPAKP